MIDLAMTPFGVIMMAIASLVGVLVILHLFQYVRGYIDGVLMSEGELRAWRKARKEKEERDR